MAAAEGVGAREGNDLLVVEAHTVENVAEVVGALGGIGETTIRSAGRDITVRTARAVGDVGALHLLDGADTAEDPEIRVGYPGEFG